MVIYNLLTRVTRCRRLQVGATCGWAEHQHYRSAILRGQGEIKYPYGKLDLVGLEDFSAGAMENTGCITFRELLLLIDEKHSSIDAKRGVASTIAHEMTDQWFGDLVTDEWWDDFWLNGLTLGTDGNLYGVTAANPDRITSI